MSSSTTEPIRSYSRDGLHFDVTDTGPVDGRCVIALHGFPEDRHCWDAVSGHLGAMGYRVLCPDQRGYSPGARPSGRRQYAIGELAGDVLALADTVGADRFDVIGHDWGGAVAWELAGRHPDRIRSATVLSTPHPSAFRDGLLRSNQAVHSWYMAAFQVPVLPEMLLARAGASRNALRLVADGLEEEAAARYASRLADRRASQGPINWYRALPWSASHPTPAITVPTLYVWSDRDRYLNRYSAERTARYVTGPYRFEVIAGASHWLPETEHLRIGGLIAEHLRTA